MKHIYLNLKRFDIPTQMGGVNSIAPITQWGRYIIEKTQDMLKAYQPDNVEFVMFFPEAHLIMAVEAKSDKSPIGIGSQSVFWNDTSVGGNFGAFTTCRTANSMCAVGCSHTIIGHCEERKAISEILQQARVEDKVSANIILNRKIRAAIKAGLKVLYCIGETTEEHEKWQATLGLQLEMGLDGIDLRDIVVAYEPIWSIGPGKTPAEKSHITDTAQFIKKIADGTDVVYGGGLKEDNAEMLSSIEEIDGGLIALTRFTGDIGFYPDEYLKISKLYLDGVGIKPNRGGQ